MLSHYSVVALDLAERVREADEYRLAAAVRTARGNTPGRIRRSTAVVLATIGSAAASVARRLDGPASADLAERDGFAARQ